MNFPNPITPDGARQIEQLHATHGVEMERFATRRARCPEQGRDLAMEALAKLAPRIETIAPGSAPAYWQRSIVNLIITKFRRERGVVVMSLDELTGEAAASERPGGVVTQFAAPDTPVQLELERQMTRDIVRQAVAELPLHQREAIVLFYFYGFSVAEVARATRTVEGTVKSRLKRARDRLERRLGGI